MTLSLTELEAAAQQARLIDPSLSEEVIAAAAAAMLIFEPVGETLVEAIVRLAREIASGL